MRVTIFPVDDPANMIVMVDSSSLNSMYIRGEACVLLHEGLEGWYESLTPSLSLDRIPTQDGAWNPSIVTLEPRVLTIRGAYYSAGSMLAAGLFRDRLALLPGRELVVRVEDELGVREVHGWVSDTVDIQPVGAWACQFTLQISCPDPLKYGHEVSLTVTDNLASAENTGNHATFPVFTISSPITRFTAECSGKSFMWTCDYASPLTIDMRLGIPRVPDGQIVGTASIDDLISFLPGVNSMTVSTMPAHTAVTCGWRPAWV